MLKIRLRREGSKNHPFFRIVVSDARNTPTGPTVATIGHYAPKRNPAMVELDLEAYDGWLKKGAHPSDTVRVLADAKRRAANAG